MGTKMKAVEPAGFDDFWVQFEPALRDACLKVWLARTAKRVGEWSPIEFAFARAFLMENFFLGKDAYYFNSTWFSCDDQRKRLRRTIESEVEVGPYRIDFLLVDTYGPRSVMCAIECDGHEFHERSKAQAARDRKRDRDLQGRGYSVLRFTGSELWADPHACAREVFKLTDQLSGRLQ